MTYYEIIMKLIGRVNPVGESNADAEARENLIELCTLTGQLVDKITNVVENNRGRQEQSIKIMSDYAARFIKELSEHLTNATT